jgi:hypothetical protein
VERTGTWQLDILSMKTDRNQQLGKFRLMLQDNTNIYQEIGSEDTNLNKMNHNRAQ